MTATLRHPRPWPLGKHKGKPWDEVPTDYLLWLLESADWFAGPKWRSLRRAVAAEVAARDARLREEAEAARQEYQREDAAEWRARLDAKLPKGRPCTIDGIALDATQAGHLARAHAAGVLVLTPDLPVNSPVEAAWKAWCASRGRPARVREVGPDESPEGRRP